MEFSKDDLIYVLGRKTLEIEMLTLQLATARQEIARLNAGDDQDQETSETPSEE